MIERTLMACDRAIPSYPPILDFLRETAPDVLLVSPLVDAASKQVAWIKGARALGIRTCVCVASWDNLTNKGLLRIEPDLVVVWNDALKREAHQYHYIPEEKIVTTGAQLFDRWFASRMTRSRDEFCARVGLPDGRPFLLFTGSSSFISESHAEATFVRRWVAALRSSADPRMQEVNVLVRPHPYNCRAWDPDPVADLRGVAVFPRRGYNPIDADNRADFLRLELSFGSRGRHQHECHDRGSHYRSPGVLATDRRIRGPRRRAPFIFTTCCQKMAAASGLRRRSRSTYGN